MKSYSKYIGLMLLPLFAASCSDGSDSVFIDMPSPADQMKLTSNVPEEGIVLSANDPDAIALSLTWGEASMPAGIQSSKYIFRMDIAGNQYATALPFEEVADFKVEFTNDDLNDILQKWQVSPGTMAELEAQVVCQYEDTLVYHMPEVSSTSFFVTGYAPVSRPVFMFNGAIDPGYNTYCNLAPTNEATEVVLGKEYTWRGWFSKDEGVYFAYDKDAKTPAIVAGGAAGSIQVIETVPTADQMLYAPKDGYYEVKISTKAKTVEWNIIVPWDHLYGVGSAFACGWNLDAPQELFPDPENPEIFVYEGETFGNGEFKMYTQKGNFGNDGFMPPCSSPGQQTNYTFTSGVTAPLAVIPGSNPDNKFFFPEAGMWRFEVNLNLMTVKATKL